MNKLVKKVKAASVKSVNPTAPVEPARTAREPLPASPPVAAPVRLQTAAQSLMPAAPPAQLAVVKASAPTPASKPNRVSLEFVKPEAKRVFVAGSFNGWKPEAMPLRLAGNGRWVGDLAVKPGRHEYLFVVDGQWLPDPNAKEFVANPFGGTNSVLVVKE